MRQLAGLSRPVVVARIERDVGAELFGQFQPPRADVGDEDLAGAGGPGDRDGHQPDDADAGDQHARPLTPAAITVCMALPSGSKIAAT